MESIVVNPYVVIDCQGTRNETAVCHRAGNRPIWNETLRSFAIKGDIDLNQSSNSDHSPHFATLMDTMKIQIFDIDENMGNKLIGEASFKLSELQL